MGLIRFILIVFAFYLFFRVFTSVVLPFIVKRSLRKFQDKFYQRNPNAHTQDKNKEGEVTIKDSGHQEEVKIPEDFGEYIDYEDIK